MLLIIVIVLVPFRMFAQPDHPSNMGDSSNVKVVDSEAKDKASFEEYISFEGRIIKKIQLRILDVSGPSVDDDSDSDTSWIGGIVNALHFKTRDWVVENILLFSEGDSLDALELSESERLLRTMGYFLDARIRVKDTQSDSGGVTVEVVTKDKWTLVPLLSFNSRNNTSYLGVRDYNFIGFGHILDASVSYDGNANGGWGGIMKYNALNVGGSFINIGANLESNRTINLQNISLSRPNLSTLFDWTGGLDLTFEQGDFEYLDPDRVTVRIPFKLNFQDVWIGKSYPLWFGGQALRDKTKLFSSARISRLNHSTRPPVDSTTNRIFENYTLYLASLGIINQRFYKDNYLAGYGTTEDVAVGGYFAVTGGIEDRQFGERWYTSIEAIFSRRFFFGYMSLKAGAGAFRNLNKWEQSTVNVNLLYHSPLYFDAGWKFRFLVNNDFLYGYSRFQGEQIYLDSESGLRGFSRFSYFGTKRIVLNTEALVFSPFAPLGFVIGAMVFADLGVIAGVNENLFKSKLYQGYGVGLRINNESISRTGFQVSVVYNPVVPNNDTGEVKIIFSGSIVFSTRVFGFFRPSILNYNGAR